MSDLLPGGNAELTLRAKRSTYNRGERNSKDERDGYSMDEELLILCGVGPSKAPSCLPVIGLAYTEKYHPYSSKRNPDRNPELKAEWRLGLRYGKEGVTVSAEKGAKDLQPETRGLLGLHPLRFP